MFKKIYILFDYEQKDPLVFIFPVIYNVHNIKTADPLNAYFYVNAFGALAVGIIGRVGIHV